jgi:hypothetical protein
LIRLDRIVRQNSGISARRALKRMNDLHVTVRTVRNYLTRLGWRTIRTKYCQFVSNKNLYERFVYAKICLLSHERFYYHIFMDECTVELVRHGSFFRVKDAPDQIKLVGRYAHEASIHIIGAISRRGRSELYIIHGSLNSNGLQYLSDRFLLPFIRRMFPTHHCLYIDGAGHHLLLQLNYISKEISI